MRETRLAALRVEVLAMGGPKTYVFLEAKPFDGDHSRFRRLGPDPLSQTGKNLRVNPVAANFLAFFFKIHSSSTFPARGQIREKEIVAAGKDGSPDARAGSLESFLLSTRK